MTIKITSDSTCDLSKELVAKYNIGIIPLYVVKDGVSLKDGLEITPEDIFAFTDSTGKLCTTAAVSQYDYTETFRPLSEQYDAVIHITISADFSSCYQNACAAAEEFPTSMSWTRAICPPDTATSSSRRLSWPNRALRLRKSARA